MCPLIPDNNDPSGNAEPSDTPKLEKEDLFQLHTQQSNNKQSDSNKQ